MKNTFLKIVVVSNILSCSGQEERFSSENITKSACECFEKQKSESIDEKLTPCLAKLINDNQQVIHDVFYPDLSLEEAVSKHLMKSMVHMVHNCDKFYDEIDVMFTNMYPEISYDQVEKEVDSLSKSIEAIANNDSIKLGLIHQKISLLTKARRLDESLNEIEYLSKNYSPSETYFIKMYIYMIQKKYDQSLQEIEKAIKQGKNGYALYAEIIKRKKNDR